MTGRTSDQPRRQRRRSRRQHGEHRHVYRCNLCRWHVVTVQIDAGEIPNSIGCRNPTGCPAVATEYIGDPRPWPSGIPITATHEWYEPTLEQLDAAQRIGGAIWKHLSAGGLMLRERPKHRRTP